MAFGVLQRVLSSYQVEIMMGHTLKFSDSFNKGGVLILTMASGQEVCFTPATCGHPPLSL